MPVADESQVVDPLLGRLLTTRRRRGIYLTVALLLGPLGAAFTLGGVGILIAVAQGIGGRGGGGMYAGPKWQGGVILLTIGLLSLAAVVQAVRQARTKLSFHELGAVRTRGRSRVAIPYADAASLVMSLQHQSLHGVHTGTIVRFKLRAADKRSISYTGGYKVRARGFLQRRYEILDDLEQVRETIAEQMADGLVESMLRGKSIDWCGRAALTPAGLVPGRGSWKGQLVPYADIERQAMETGTLTLFAREERRGFVSFPASGVNFWPCYAVFLRLAQQQAAVEPMPGTPSENGDDVEDED